MKSTAASFGSNVYRRLKPFVSLFRETCSTNFLSSRSNTPETTIGFVSSEADAMRCDVSAGGAAPLLSQLKTASRSATPSKCSQPICNVASPIAWPLSIFDRKRPNFLFANFVCSSVYSQRSLRTINSGQSSATGFVRSLCARWRQRFPRLGLRKKTNTKRRADTGPFLWAKRGEPRGHSYPRIVPSRQLGSQMVHRGNHSFLLKNPPAVPGAAQRVDEVLNQHLTT